MSQRARSWPRLHQLRWPRAAAARRRDASWSRRSPARRRADRDRSRAPRPPRRRCRRPKRGFGLAARAPASRRRRKRPAARRVRPLPSACARGREPDHRVVAVAAGELGEADAGVRGRGRHADRGQHVARPERGLEQALEEIVGLRRCACPCGPAISTSPPSASRQAGSSAAGSAKAIEPPIVPRLRIAGWPMCGMASAISGACLAMSAERSASAWRASAPISTLPSLTRDAGRGRRCR